MNKKKQIGIIIIIILALITLYLALMPQYKEIKMSGYTFEVPNSNAEVKNNTANYNTYLDTENDLTIKTWACNDINDMNGTINGSMEMRLQLGENMGSNCTYNNITLYNKSGVYTYYEPNIENSCMILITSKNPDAIKHIIETMIKPQLTVDSNQFNMTSSGLILTDSNNNTTDNQTNINTQTTTQKKTNKNKQSKSDTIYKSSDPEASGEYVGVGEGIYRNKKTGDVYTEHGRGNLVRTPELDNSPYF